MSNTGIFTISLAALAIMGCKASPNGDDTADAPNDHTNLSDELSTTNPMGGCVIESPTGTVPDDLYQNTGVVENDDYPPFTKTLTVNGITLLGNDDNADAFMEDVGTAIDEMFSQTASGIDPTLQALVMRAMYERRTVIPFFKSDGDSEPEFTNAEWMQFEQIEENNSLCDVIFEFGGNGQTMEVMEHILHHVNMVGLHYALIDSWGIVEGSDVHTYMGEAIANGYYNANYDDEIDDPAEAARVWLQEYTYWVITTGWDIQETYGGDGGGGEWTLQNLDDFQASQPEMAQLFDDTIPKVMVAPSDATLSGFGG